MSQVLDYSLARPDPAAIVAAGYVGVLRYVAPAMDAPKIIYQPEYAALLSHGLKVVLNWEWYADRPREGAAAGTADAQEALRQADALGYTGAIYFSVDYNAPDSDQPAINAYFQACAQVIGLNRLGAYGGYWPLSRLFDAGLIVYGWQTLAWSGGKRESRAHLYQNGAQALGACDVNDVLKSDWAGGNMVPKGPFVWLVVSDPAKGIVGEIPAGTTLQELADGYGLMLSDIVALNPWAASYNATKAGVINGSEVKLPGYPQATSGKTPEEKAVLDAAKALFAAVPKLP